MKTGEYLGPSQAARQLGISHSYIRKLADNGALDGVTTPLGRLITKASVERFAKERAERKGGRR